MLGLAAGYSGSGLVTLTAIERSETWLKAA
jgi:hypothetical protein